MASAQPASAFPCLSLQLACLLLGAWLAFDAHGGGQAVAPPARVEARVPTAATDDWGRQPDSLMSAVPPRTLEASSAPAARDRRVRDCGSPIPTSACTTTSVSSSSAC